MQRRYFESFQVGDSFDLGSISVTAEEIIAFARQFDPQPFHLSAEPVGESVFDGLVASGWHTTALFMRLLVDGLLHETVSMGSPGVDQIRWLRPVHPGDTLRGGFTILACAPSRSRPNLGVVRSRCELFNQDDETVLTLEGVHFLGREPSSQA